MPAVTVAERSCAEELAAAHEEIRHLREEVRRLREGVAPPTLDQHIERLEFEIGSIKALLRAERDGRLGRRLVEPEPTATPSPISIATPRVTSETVVSPSEAGSSHSSQNYYSAYYKSQSEYK